MVQIDIEYQGALRTQAVHAPSGSTLVTDAPVDNRGRGESFSPTDLVATALGTCMVTIMGMAADDNGWRFTGTRVRVVKKMASQPARKIAALEIVVSVPHDLDAAARETLERVARTCPVYTTLAGNVATPLRFEWGAALATGGAE